MMHFVRTFSIMRAFCVRLIATEEAQNYGKIVGLYITNILHDGWWGNAIASSYPPGSAPGHTLQKPWKESGIFQSSLILLFFTKRQIKRRGQGEGEGTTPPPPKYAPDSTPSKS